MLPELRPPDWVLKVEARCQCPSLLRRVREGKAAYAVQVEAAAPLFRGFYPSPDPRFEVAIPADRVGGWVEVVVMVVATRPLPRYAVDGANPVYAGRTFAVGPGDILAVAVDEHYGFDLSRDRDPLRRVGSVVQVVRGLAPGDRPAGVAFGGRQDHRRAEPGRLRRLLQTNHKMKKLYTVNKRQDLGVHAAAAKTGRLHTPKQPSKTVEYVREHNLLGNAWPSRALTRSGMARLWWYAHLTDDPVRPGPYELTRVLLSDLDWAQSVLERNFDASGAASGLVGPPRPAPA